MKINSLISNHIDNRKRDKILISCRDLSHFDMALNLAVCDEFEYVIYFNNAKELRKVAENLPSNIRLTQDNSLICAQLWKFACIFSFNTLSSPLHIMSQPFLGIAKTVGIPVIDIQHGLFQHSINNFDDSKILSLTNNRYGCGSLVSFADHQIKWFENDGIGYPKKLTTRISSEVPPFVLISSNINWYVYSEQNRLHWISLLRQIVSKHHDLLFIWKPHPSESAVCSQYFSACKSIDSKNFLHYGIENDIYFNDVDNHQDLAYLSTAGIITTGTSVLDFALAKKPCCVYDLPQTEQLVATIPTIDKFSCLDSLDDFCSRVKNHTARPVDLQLDLSYKPQRMAELTRQYADSTKLSEVKVGEILKALVSLPTIAEL